MPDRENDFDPVFSKAIFHGYFVRRVLGTPTADYAEKWDVRRTQVQSTLTFPAGKLF
jgi:hypothetical protein